VWLPAGIADARGTVIVSRSDGHQNVVLCPGALGEGVLEVGDADLELICARAEGRTVISDRGVVRLAEPNEIVAVTCV